MKITIKGVKYDRNKMRKTRILLGDSRVRAAIPKTVMLTTNNLRNMLRAYGMVYVKPNVGALGNGVMRTRKLKSGGYEWRYKLMKRKVSTVAQLYRLIRQHKLGGSYIVQRGIHMMKYNGRSFDLRVMTQRVHPHGSFVITGMLARVAAKGKVVTNGSKGATIHTTRQVFKSKLSNSGAISLERKVAILGLRIARRYAVAYPRCIELGLDIAVDNKRRAWLLEVNTTPQITPFRKLKDLTMYRRILAYR
ncbi:YheC/YheD family protein [Paenibacillus kobensis]|uniref:YheC/YheD family protein n=1 Tax=Paenibacillus kobensis TaxID=59841 RepID=UPI0013E37A54|nr:YheC/YheD family protein [Paenibacillus kobensis]